MKTIALSTAVLLCSSALGWAQELMPSALRGASPLYDDGPRIPAAFQEPPNSDRTETLSQEDSSLSIARPTTESLPADLPASEEDHSSAFSLGPAGGYLRVRQADRGTWFAGVQARLHLGIFAAEASVQYHRNSFEDSSVIVSQYPVQLTAFLYPIPVGPIRPYILGGVGWYYTQYDYEGPNSFIANRTEHIFGEHLGAGVELFFSPTVSVDADARYIFLNPTTDQVLGRQFNYWQVTFGVNFFF